jgi:hypothetical protein
MDDHDIDELIRTDAAAWQRANDHSSIEQRAALTVRHRVRARGLVLAGVTAVIAALGIAVLATQVHRHRGGSGTGTPPTVVSELPTAPPITDPQTPGPFQDSRAGAFSPVHRIGPATTVDSGNKVVSMSWRLAQLSKDGRSIKIVFVAGGGCTSLLGISVTENVDSVLIASIGVEPSPIPTVAPDGTPIGGCTNELKIGDGIITLSAPLANRPLLHAPVNPEWGELP